MQRIFKMQTLYVYEYLYIYIGQIIFKMCEYICLYISKFRGKARISSVWVPGSGKDEFVGF